jgi:hypothetical protein
MSSVKYKATFIQNSQRLSTPHNIIVHPNKLIENGNPAHWHFLSSDVTSEASRLRQNYQDNFFFIIL